jgi:hypothetical protein
MDTRHTLDTFSKYASLISFAVTLLACGGQQIEPLDPRDLSLPQETRRWIAAAEDGVVVARARLENMRSLRSRQQKQREDALEEIDFGAAGANLRKAMIARFDYLEATTDVQLARAEVELELAEAKYDLATAEQAMLHDLARYDLERHKRRVEAARRKLNESRDQLRATREKLDRATSAFWQEYAKFLKQGGETLPFWIGKKPQLPKVENGPQSETKTAVSGL